MICPTCHTPVTPGMDFCLRCGTEVRGHLAELEDSAPGLSVPPSTPLPSRQLASSPRSPSIPALHSDASTVPAPTGSELPPLLYAPRLPWQLRLFGPVADPASAVPYSRAQTWLRRLVGPRTATRPWLTAGGGALVALLLGLALMLPGAWIWRHGLAAASGLIGVYIPAAGIIGLGLVPLLTLDPLKLFLLAQHVPVDYAQSVGGGGTSHLSLSLPLTGMLLLPALALTLGGYLSAASEYGRVPRYAIARGALIGPIYGMLLFALALIAARSPFHATSFGNLSLAPLPAWALFYGILWGVLFGALGGWIHASGRAWLVAALPVLRGAGAPRVAGALAGAGVALLCGVVLYLALGLGAAAFTSVHAIFSPSVSADLPATPSALTLQQGQPLLTSGPALVAGTLAGVLVLGVPSALWLFPLGTGAPWAASVRQLGPSGSGAHLNESWSLGFVGAQHAPPQIALLLAVVPVMGYLVGGRLAARVAGAERRETAFAAGAAISIPLAVVLAGLAWLASASIDPTGGTQVTEQIGPSVAGTAIATLFVGGLVGGIGGISALRAPWLGEVPGWLLTPVRALGRPLLPLLDRLSGHSSPTPAKPLSLARRWLYDAALVALGLGVLAVVADTVTLVWATPGAFQRMRVVDSLLAALLATLPLLCGLMALISALVTTSPARLPALGAPLRAPVYLAVPHATLPDAPHAAPAATPLPVPSSQPEPLSRGQPRDYAPPARQRTRWRQ